MNTTISPIKTVATLSMALAIALGLSSCEMLNDPEYRQVIGDSLQQGLSNAAEILNQPRTFGPGPSYGAGSGSDDWTLPRAVAY